MFNLEGIVNLLVGSNPQLGGILNQVKQMAAAGSDPAAIMGAMEAQAPHLKNNGIWNNLKGKSGSEIESYAGNLAKSLGIFK